MSEVSCTEGEDNSASARPETPHFFVLDGATGTLVERCGLTAASLGSMWSTSALLTHVEVVRYVHKSYVDAGADIILTNTYQMHAAGCKEAGVTMDEVVNIAVRVLQDCIPPERVAATREAKVQGVLSDKSSAVTRSVFAPLLCGVREDALKCPVLVGGSLGSYGASLEGAREYCGDYEVSEAVVKDYYVGRLKAFVGRSGEEAHLKVDFIMIETIPLLREAMELFTWLKHQTEDEGLQSAPVCLSFISRLTVPRPDANADDAGVGAWWEAAESSIHLVDGSTYEEAFNSVMGLQLPQLSGFGTNCCSPLEASVVASLLLKKKRKNITDRPLALFLYSNSGESFEEGGWHWGGELPRGSQPQASKFGEIMAPATLRRLMLCSEADVRTAAFFAYQSLLQRPTANDWLFDIVICGGCCRSTPEDIAAIRTLL